jgi:hypothetical protein
VRTTYPVAVEHHIAFGAMGLQLLGQLVTALALLVAIIVLHSVLLGNVAELQETNKVHVENL